jgi:hypothetical protein
MAMKWLFLSLALAALPACGEQQGAEFAPIALYTQFPHEPPPAVYDALRSTVESIMAPIGLSFEWRQTGEIAESHVFVELAVVTFKGNCDLKGVPPNRFTSGPLGWTHISDDVILPFAEIDCTAVRAFLNRDLLFERPEQRKFLFGRALGRVVAHELYHIFANTRHHGAEGVAREIYSVRDLLDNNFRFEAKESIALRNGPAHAALVTASQAPTSDESDTTSHRQL